MSKYTLDNPLTTVLHEMGFSRNVLAWPERKLRMKVIKKSPRASVR